MIMMKNIFAFCLVAVVAFLVGCPSAVVPVDNPVDQVVDQTTGSITIEGDLFAVESTKGDPAIGEAMKQNAAWIAVALTPVDPTVQNYPYFTIPVIDGHYEGVCKGILPGVWTVNVYLQDKNWYNLFGGVTTTVIEGGSNSPVTVLLDFMSEYQFNFSIKDLPGEYIFRDSEFGQWLDCRVRFFDSEGQDRFIGYTKNADGNLEYMVSVPLDFNGGTLKITDSLGVERICDLPLTPSSLPWTVFQFGDKLTFDYVESNRYGGVDINIDFNFKK